MSNLIIVGTGGLAAELTDYVADNQKNLPGYKLTIKGYLDISDANHAKYKFRKPLLGSEKSYDPVKNDVFIIALGNHETSKKAILKLKSKDARFCNFIHHSSVVSQSATLGIGNIIAPFCTIGPNAIIGNFNIINCYSLLAHDCQVRDFNIFSPNNMITGNCTVGSDNFFGTSVTAYPKTTIGSRVKIQAGLVIKGELPDGYLYYSDKTHKSIEI
jgi:sugar O-acyltransferase (sialic acid O-acetyltransferase NeuD family)